MGENDRRISEKARQILNAGSIKVRVVRSGMAQQLTFTVKKVKFGNIEYTELFTGRTVDLAEIKRIVTEIGLPVEAQNCKVFPEGTSASDFQGL